MTAYIRIPKTTEDQLGDLTGYDAAASIDEYNCLVLAAAKENYPDADIDFTESNYQTIVDAFDDDGRTLEDIEWNLESVFATIFESGEWAVEEPC